MKSNKFTSVLAAYVALFMFAAGCNTPAQETAADTSAAVTNPLFTIAPEEYAVLAEEAIMHVADDELEAWGAMMTDDVEFDFPDGDANTRTKLMGKVAVLDWWKKYREMPGVGAMTSSDFNHFPVEIIGDPKAGVSKGVYVISYFTNSQIINGQTVSVRMNFATLFNADKKIATYYTYYDRTGIVQALGQNVLADSKAK